MVLAETANINHLLSNSIMVTTTAVIMYGYGMHGDRDYRGHRQRGHMMDRNYGESRMFNGITLTEQQRTQMRDLMRQSR